MAKWEMNIGSVEKYNKEERKWQNGVLTIKYNSDEYFKVVISFEYLEGKTCNISADFIVSVLDEDLGKVEIDSELYIFSYEQIKKLQTKREFFDNIDYQYNDVNKSSRFELYLGLSKHYDSENDEYCTCDIEIKKEIDFYVFIVKQYDELFKTTEKINTYSFRIDSFKVNILDVSQGWVEISEELFCFSSDQINLLQHIHEFFLNKEVSFNTIRNTFNELSQPNLYLGLAVYYNERYKEYFDCDVVVKKEKDEVLFYIKQYDKYSSIVVAINILFINSNFPHPNTPKSQESSREQTINYAATHENGNDLRR